MTRPLMIDPSRAALVTDLYQLTMMAAYRQNRRRQRATFEGFVRKLPARRSFLLFAGLEQVVDYLLRLKFDGAEIDWLRGREAFGGVEPAFFEYLREFRFQGDLWAMPEGTVFFGNEPVVRITADIPEAQLPETFLLSLLNVQTMVASKAARVVQAAAGRGVFEFGLRRAHGPQAGIYASRAAYIAGCVGTSNVFAGRELGIPITGTMAHAWVQSFDDEAEAFARFHDVFPHHTTALVDTYETVEGARRAARLGKGLAAVRLDSGDLADLSKRVRAVLREAGCKDTKIVASNDLNEDSITELIAGGAEIDVFGVGTEMVVSRDAPALGYVYKLVQTEENGKVIPRVKLAKGKATWPTAKQVYRRTGADGRFAGDTLAPADEPPPAGEPLLTQVIKGGSLVAPLPGLEQIRSRAAAQLAALPDDVKRFVEPAAYPVTPAPSLVKLQEELMALRARRNEQ